MPDQGARVLVVEDDADMRRVLFLALTDEGYEVALADFGASGLKAAIDARPAVVLLDLDLPDMSGAEVGRRLRDTLGDAVRIVVLSGSDSIAACARGMHADAYFPKPFDLDEVLATVDRVSDQDGAQASRPDLSMVRTAADREIPQLALAGS